MRFLRPTTQLHHPCPGEGELVPTGTAHDDVVQDAHADVLQGLGDLVGGVDVLFGRIALLSGVTYGALSRRLGKRLPAFCLDRLSRTPPFHFVADWTSSPDATVQFRLTFP